MTPTRVQLSSGPVKYETPLFRVAMSVFRSAHKFEVMVTNEAANFSRVFGFVALLKELDFY